MCLHPLRDSQPDHGQHDQQHSPDRVGPQVTGEEGTSNISRVQDSGAHTQRPHRTETDRHGHPHTGTPRRSHTARHHHGHAPTGTAPRRRHAPTRAAPRHGHAPRRTALRHRRVPTGTHHRGHAPACTALRHRRVPTGTHRHGHVPAGTVLRRRHASTGTHCHGHVPAGTVLCRRHASTGTIRCRRNVPVRTARHRYGLGSPGTEPQEGGIGRGRRREGGGDPGNRLAESQQRERELGEDDRHRQRQPQWEQSRIPHHDERDQGEQQGCVVESAELVDSRQTDPPGRVAVQEEQRDTEHRDGLGRGGEAPPHQKLRHGEGQRGDPGEDGRPPADADVSPADHREHDGRDDQQQAAESEQQVLYGLRREVPPRHSRTRETAGPLVPTGPTRSAGSGRSTMSAGTTGTIRAAGAIRAVGVSESRRHGRGPAALRHRRRRSGERARVARPRHRRYGTSRCRLPYFLITLARAAPFGPEQVQQLTPP